MRKVVWKFSFNIGKGNHLSIPKGAKILHVDCQDNIPCLWVEVDPEAPLEDIAIHVIGTGHHFDSAGLYYIGTFQSPPFVWHIYKEG